LDHLSEKFRVTSYDCRQMREHHNSLKHEYLIPKSVLDADVVINLPKLKTHRKVGLTASLKNIVGINGHKDWLPHHRCGSVDEGGDEYRNRSFFKRLQTHLGEKTDQDSHNSRNFFQRLMIRITDKLARSMAPDPFFEGSWHGNDTLWRTVLDLNRLLVYANKDGKMTEAPQRKCMTIVDAIVAGEMFIHLMKEFPIKKYQFVQVSDSKVVLRVKKSDNVGNGVKEKITDTYKKYLPDQVRLDFSEIDGFEKTATGKFRFVYSEIPSPR
jgi:hypothetical protein